MDRRTINRQYMHVHVHVYMCVYVPDMHVSAPASISSSRMANAAETPQKTRPLLLPAIPKRGMHRTLSLPYLIGNPIPNPQYDPSSRFATAVPKRLGARAAYGQGPSLAFPIP